MDFGDFLGGLAQIGGEDKRWRSLLATLGLLIGAVLGGMAAGVLGDVSMIGFVLGGAFFGWIGALILRGLAVIIFLTLAVLAIGAAWTWATGTSFW